MSAPKSNITTLLSNTKAKRSKAHHQTVMQEIFKSLIAILIIEIKKAEELKKPIFILAGESHRGLKEFVAKILLSSAASCLGIKHHCLESNYYFESDEEAVKIFSKKFVDELFIRHLATLGVYVTEADRGKDALSAKLQEELDSNIPRNQREKESLIRRFNASFRVRNQVMADFASMPGAPGILYVGMGHFREIFEFLEDRFHVVTMDVADISADKLAQFNEVVQKETGFTMQEIEFSYDFILTSLATGALKKVYISIIEAAENDCYAGSSIGSDCDAFKDANRYYEKVLRNVLIENDALLSANPATIKREFLASKLNQPLLHQFSLVKQREDQGWVQEMSTMKQAIVPRGKFHN